MGKRESAIEIRQAAPTDYLEGLQGNQCNDQRIAEGPVRIADRAGAIVRQKSTKRPPGILKRYQAAEE